MRHLSSHIVNPANDRITIAVVDQPGAGGANHQYVVDIDGKASVGINFQNGPIAEAGVNGLTHEALLAILADRLVCFQAGPYACDENAAALAHIQSAQGVLQDRTRRRMEAGIEGTHKLDPEGREGFSGIDEANEDLPEPDADTEAERTAEEAEIAAGGDITTDTTAQEG